MICKVCGSEFSEDNFDVCPYCMTPVEKGMSLEIEVSLSDSNREEIEEDSQKTDDTVCSSEDSCQGFDILDDFQITEADLIEERDSADADISIDELGLSVRAVNAFRRASIFTLGELLAFLVNDSVSSLRSAGAKTVEETELLLKRISHGEFVGMKMESAIPPRNIFEDISPDLDYLSVEALSELGLSSHCVSKLQQYGIRCCGELRALSDKTLKQIVGYNYYDRLPLLAEKLKKDIITLLEQVLDGSRGTRECEVFIRRAKGETLQEIADTPGKIGPSHVTRERVRQIERAYGRTIMPFVNELVYILRGSKPYLTVQDLLDIYDDDDYDLILVYACKLDDDFIYLDFADLFVEKKLSIASEISIFALIGEFVGNGIDLTENMDALDAMLFENGLDFLSVDAIVNLLRKHNYHLYGDFVSKGKANYATICMDVIKRYFPDGIKLSQSEGDQSEDIRRLRSIVNEKYPGLELPCGDRSISSTLVRSGLILRGRGQYISEEHISVDDSLLSEIREYIDSRQTDKVFYNEVYAEYAGALNLLCGVDNYNYLHGILALKFPDVYEYSRDYLLKNGKKDFQTESISDRINAFICSMGRAVSKKELQQEFKGFSDVMLFMPFISDSRLFQWEYNAYSCKGVLNVEEDDIEGLETILNCIFDENKGYASDPMFFKKVQSEMPEFISRNNIRSEMNLHYVAANLLQDRIDFHRPHIGRRGSIDVSSTKNVALHLLGRPESFYYNQYINLADAMGWSRVTASAVLSEIESDYYRIAVDKYIAKESLVVPDEVAKGVYQIVRDNMEDGILPLIDLDTEDYPEWTYSWNEFLVESVVRSCFDDVRIVQPNMSDRRYQRGFLTLKERNIMTYPQIVAIKMRRFGYEKMTESQFLTFLLVHNLARKVIPSELTNSDFVKKDGDFFCIVNGCIE